MKKLKSVTIKLFGVIIIITCFFSSCNDDYLNEVPKSFLSPENTFVDKDGFESGINDLYRISRTLVAVTKLPGMISAERDKDIAALYCDGTDLGWYFDKKTYMADYSTLNSTDEMTQNFWVRFYTMVKEANVILTRSESEDAEWDSENDKLEIQAYASFFRAWAYRYLVHLWGGVPIINEEITTPKVDFVRNTKQEVIDFIIEDLEFATQYLPETNNRDGKLSKAAADQLLAEMYITNGEYDKSIDASSRIIDDSQYQLMTERFGTSTDVEGLFIGSVPPSFEQTDNPGDVFWDLFRLGNQSISENKEVILAWQFEYNVTGGVGYRWERIFGPKLESLKTPDGMSAIPKDEYLGRPVRLNRISDYVEFDIWQSDWDNDIRNSVYNIQREFYINNPESEYYGEKIEPTQSNIDGYHYFSYIKKASHPYGHPQGYDGEGKLYSDFYAMRLAETYLLRAEAYLDNGDKVNAAADINVVRSRANATPVDPSDVDIDYILDERARELVLEEPRRLTLARLGLLYERVQKYNSVAGPTIQEFNNLLPIPQTEIDTNTGAELTQNPGY